MWLSTWHHRGPAALNTMDKGLINKIIDMSDDEMALILVLSFWNPFTERQDHHRSSLIRHEYRQQKEETLSEATEEGERGVGSERT